jgi:hypothetical protein
MTRYRIQWPENSKEGLTVVDTKRDQVVFGPAILGVVAVWCDGANKADERAKEST